VRLFSFRTGKTRRTYDESSESLHALQKDGDDAYRLEALDELSMNLSVINESLLTDDAYRREAFDFGRRMAVEREYRASPEAYIHTYSLPDGRQHRTRDVLPPPRAAHCTAVSLRSALRVAG